ncbi:MAG: SDR family NAD(P)-dependent oxidoreductase [Novosphingobium sp.]
MSSTATDFTGQVAVVTGAGRGLGSGYARFLAARGASVVVNDHGTELDGEGFAKGPADETVDAIHAGGGTAIANHASVAEPDGAAAIVEDALTAFGRIDILICNAGVWSCQPLEETTDAIWARTMGVHVGGTMMAARAALPHMKAQGFGRLVFTASSGGLYGKAGLTAYGAAKGAIYGLMRCLALELSESGIDVTVNTVLPGAQTRMISAKSASLWDDRPGLADPDHVVPLVAFLASAACRDNGRAYSAGGGYFARDEAVQGAGVRLPVDQPITPDEIARHWQAINDMSQPALFADVMDYGARMFDLHQSCSDTR